MFRSVAAECKVGGRARGSATTEMSDCDESRWPRRSGLQSRSMMEAWRHAPTCKADFAVEEDEQNYRSIGQKVLADFRAVYRSMGRQHCLLATSAV